MKGNDNSVMIIFDTFKDNLSILYLFDYNYLIIRYLPKYKFSFFINLKVIF